VSPKQTTGSIFYFTDCLSGSAFDTIFINHLMLVAEEAGGDPGFEQAGQEHSRHRANAEGVARPKTLRTC